MRLGISTALYPPDVEITPGHLNLFAEFGYQDVEIVFWHKPTPAIFLRAEELGLRMHSLHGIATDPASLDEGILRQSRQQLGAWIEQTSRLTHDKVMVLHGSDTFKDEAERARRRAALIQTLRDLLPIAADHGVRLALETCIPYPHMLGDSAAESLMILDAVDGGERLGICLDVGHSACCEEPLAACRRLAPRVITTHIQDVHATHGRCPPDRGPDFMPGHEDRHLIPGDGSLDLTGLYRILSESGYAGPWLYEVTTLDPLQPVKDPRAVLQRIAEYNRRCLPELLACAGR